MDTLVDSRLSELEAVIERGLTTFVDVGNALLEIRDSRLYRESHATFEAYCRERWGWARSRAYQLMDAAAVSNVLDNPPTNARQAAELAPLMRSDPQAVAEAWGAVLSVTDTPTAAVVREVVSEVMHREEGPSDTSSDWVALRQVMEALAAFAANDAARIAATVPDRRRAATARKLRQLGTFLGRIAWMLEREDGKQ